jgi:hypothetical protein
MNARLGKLETKSEHSCIGCVKNCVSQLTIFFLIIFPLLLLRLFRCLHAQISTRLRVSYDQLSIFNFHTQTHISSNIKIKINVFPILSILFFNTRSRSAKEVQECKNWMKLKASLWPVASSDIENTSNFPLSFTSFSNKFCVSRSRSHPSSFFLLITHLEKVLFYSLFSTHLFGHMASPKKCFSFKIYIK